MTALDLARALLAETDPGAVLDGLDARTHSALLDGGGSRADAERLLREHAAEALIAERWVARLGDPALCSTVRADDPAARLLAQVPAKARRRGVARLDTALSEGSALDTDAAAPDPEALFAGSFSARAQKRRGGVYTEPALVELLLDLVDWDGRGAFLEPAAGAGAFLVRAWERLLGGPRPGEDPGESAPPSLVGNDLHPYACRAARESAPPSLVGNDLHPYACRAARTALALSAAARGLGADALPTVAQADALAGPDGAPTEREGAWDVVVGNPPWVRGERIPADLRATYRQRNPDLGTGNVDLASYFVARALRWLKPGGVLGYVVTQGLLEARSAAGLRALLAQRTVEAVVSLEWAPPQFAQATVIPCLLVVRNAPAPADHRVRLGRALPADGDPDRLDVRWTRVHQRSWLELCRGPWPLALERGDLSLLRPMTKAPTPLKAGYGLAVRTRTKAGDLIADGPAPRFKNPQPLLDGREVRAWGIDYRGRVIDYRPDRISDPKKPAFFAGPKVLLPRIALTPQAAVDDAPRPYYARNTVMVVRAPGTSLDEHPHALAALINSLPVRAYAFHLLRAGVLAGSHRCTFYAKVASAFPVPQALLDDPRPLARLGRRCADLARQGKRESLAALEHDVDALVARAFGISDAQLDALRRRATRDPLATILRTARAGDPTRNLGVANYAAGRRYA